jgi:hypothetical protein
MALEMFQGEDAEETGMLGGGIDPKNFQLPVNRQPAPGGLSQANPFADLTKARQDALKATQDMINALERRVSGEGYDISRLLFAFGQPTATGSFGSALANLGAEASRQRSEQEKMIPSMMKMRVDLANSRLNQQEGLALNALRSGRLPGANIQAAPGSGAASEAAVAQEGQGVPQGAAQGTPQGAPSNRLSGFFGLPIDQAIEVANSFLSPEKAKEAINEWLAVNKFQRESDRVVGNAIYTQGGNWIQNPATLAEVKEFPISIGNFSGNVSMTTGDFMKYRGLLDANGPVEAAKFLTRLIPGLGERIGAIAPPRPLDSTTVAPAQQPAMQPASEAPSQAAAGPRFETAGEREQRQKAESKQTEENISMLTGEVKEARAPILTRYDKADSLQQEAKQMMQLASAYPYAVGIFNKPGGQYALAQFIKEGIRVGGTNVTIGGFEDGMRRLVRANPEMVARVAKERGISNDEAQRYLQQQGLDAASLLLQSERRLDSLLNKAERKGEGQVSNYERVLFGQLLPSLSNDPIKAYLVKTLALQEMAKFDKQVGDLLRRRSEAKQYDPRQMYDSDEYKRIRANYVNALDGSMREFFPEMRGKLAEARKVAGV